MLTNAKGEAQHENEKNKIHSSVTFQCVTEQYDSACYKEGVSQ